MQHPTDAEVEFGEEMASFLLSIANERFDADPHISQNICIECSVHISKNISRLYETHQATGNILDAKVDPLKIIANISFWIRKLKPLSRCYRGGGGADAGIEIPDINEKISLYLAEVLTVNCAYIGLLDDMKRNKDISSRLFSQNIADMFRNFDDTISSPDEPNNTIRQRMIYDMRFRTYGPHHLSHVLTQVVMSAGIK